MFGMISQDVKRELQKKKEDAQPVATRYSNMRRRQSHFIYFVIINLLIFLIFVVMLTTLITESFLVIVAMISYMAVYIIILIVLTFRQGRRRLRMRSQDAALYAAVSAAERMESGTIIEASSYATELVVALSHLTERESVNAKPWKFSLKNVLYVRPGDIRREAILEAIQDTALERDEFIERFYAIALSLYSDTAETLHMSVKDFLSWLSNNCVRYGAPPMTVWERHPNYRPSLEVAAVVGVPIIGAIAIII